MAGFDDDGATIGDWVSLDLSPRTHSTAISDNSRSSRPVLEREISFNDYNNVKEIMVEGSQGSLSMEDSEKMDSLQMGFQFSNEKSVSRGGLGERIAARAGFNAPRLNTEKIRSADFSFDSNARSPCLTIYSPGLSPATLLESPVFLSNPVVQPSPTTGKVPFKSNFNGNTQSSASTSLDQSKADFFEDIDAPFAFPPVLKSCVFLPAATSEVASVPHKSFPDTEVSVESDNSSKSQTLESVKPISETKESLHLDARVFPGSSSEKDKRTNCETADQRISDDANESSELPPPIDEPQDQELRQQSGDLMAGVAPEGDGYNWRKYGQKQVKDSEHPRGYYKCTHVDCPVKKKVERSSTCLLAETSYEGTHNHPKPQTNRQSTIGLSNPTVDLQLDVLEQKESRNVMGGNFVWARAQQGGTAGPSESVEATSAEHADRKFDYSPGGLQVQNGKRSQPGEMVDGSSAFSNGEDENKDNDRTQGNVSLGYDEPESKRKKLEVFATEMTGATRAIREPKVVVQTTSDVDIIDDGYRWRKYGQKVVKGNPNPRSYYKCTALGCTVRKHVERASNDLKSVVTTYEGKHNHDVPAARNSSQAGSGGGSSTAQQTAIASMVQTQHNSSHRFERPVSSFNTATTTSLYGGPFSFHQPRQFPGHFRMNQQGLGNMGIPRLGFGPGKMPMLPLHPQLVQQIPKGDSKMEPNSQPEFGLSNSSSIYQQMMNGLPLGPHM